MTFLYSTQAFYNFGFYGIRSIFVIYAIRQLSLAEGQAILLFATFMSLCYATGLIGGAIADGIIGIRKSVLLGVLLSFSGLLWLAFPNQESWFIGLALMSLGSGFFKTNILTAVGLFFERPKDTQKDKAYSLFYVATNIGSFLTPIISGFICVKYGWNYGILFIALTLLLATLIFYKKVHFEDLKEQSIKVNSSSIILLTLCFLVMIFLFYILFKFRESVHGLMAVISIGSVIYLGGILSKCNIHERKDVYRIIVCIVLFSFFASLYEQAGSSLMLFFEKAVDRNLLGIEIPSAAFLSLNPLFVLILTPIFLYLSKKYFEKEKPLDEFMKIGMGFLFASCGFLIFALSTYQNIFPISPWWVVIAFLIKTTGEILFVPAVLSTISKYAPSHFRSSMMSFWLMALAYSHYIGGIIAQFSLSSPNDVSQSGYDQYFPFFSSLSFMALSVAILILGYQKIRKLR